MPTTYTQFTQYIISGPLASTSVHTQEQLCQRFAVWYIILLQNNQFTNFLTIQGFSMKSSHPEYLPK